MPLSTSAEVVAPSPQVHTASVERRSVLAILILSLALGGFLRFYHLGVREMSADEGASWAAANAPTIAQVLRQQPLLNPGKFAVHEVALHGWIRLFGDGLISMRALSAIAGTLAIVVVFLLVRELLGLGSDVKRTSPDERAGARSPYELPAAFAAMLFAVSPVFIKYSQEARMYSVGLLCALIQVGFFLRSLRRPTLPVLFLTALFTALAIASTFTLSLILLPEVLWLAYLVRREPGALRPAAYNVLALIAGLAMLIPSSIVYLEARAHAPALLAYAWSSRPPLWAPISMFNKATGTFAFPVLLALALWGVVRGWREAHDATVFSVIWMLVPPVLVLVASYIIRPAFVERYLLSSFVAFFILVAFGIWNMAGFSMQTAALSLAACLALGHLHSYWSHPHDVQWREAVDEASSRTGDTIVVAPPYAADVVRYYLPASGTNWSVDPVGAKGATVAIIADSGVSASTARSMAAEYPRLLIRLRGVMVRERFVSGSHKDAGAIN